MSDHCKGTACVVYESWGEQTQSGSGSPVCECDCEDCVAARRPVHDILADAYDVIRDEPDAGDKSELFWQLTEALAAMVREQEEEAIDRAELRNRRG